MIDVCTGCINNKYDFICGSYCGLTDEPLPIRCELFEQKTYVTLDEYRVMKLKEKG